MPEINPDVLRWARETAGLSKAEAVSKLGLSPAYGQTSEQRLEALESGVAEPTRPILVKMAEKYRRPLIALYMADPPQKGDRGQDFRTLPHDYDATDDSILDALIRRLIARQRLVKELLQDDESPELDFVGSASPTDGVESVVQRLRQVLGLELETLRAQASAEEAFARLRRAAEDAGVFVLLLSNLGSYHSNIDVETFRGFALSDELAPFVVVNELDSKAAWSFTLLHELTHLLLGHTGVDGLRADAVVEQFSNDVASEFLLPMSEIGALPLSGATPQDELAHTISAFANDRNLSRSMVAYKAYRADMIDRTQWEALQRQFRNEWLEARGRAREAGRESEGGPSYYVVRRHRLGEPLLNLVDRSMSEGDLSTSKAGLLLGVKPKNVRTLVESG